MKKPVRRRGYQDGGQVQDAQPLDPGPSAGDRLKNMVSGGMTAAKLYQMATAAPAAAGGLAGALGGAAALARGGKIKRTAGPRIGKDDGLIPAQRGEYVVRKSAVKKLGTKALDQVNKGKLPNARSR